MSTTVRSEYCDTDGVSWQSLGSCKGLDSTLFFHPDGERGRARSTRERSAKKICRECPVLSQCRAYALSTKQTYGIWGGMSEQERQDQLYASEGVKPRLKRRRTT
ncbi:WhiB family transcriptional regulator [Nocardia sp. NBC_00511]|uniref:WhiB family transcriptional regulator n=1 Tax=Nocardia sp. NBC_00511 TaxID=2903591 RepID=UPI002F90BB76